MEFIVCIAVSIILFILGFYVGRMKINELKKKIKEYEETIKKADEFIYKAQQKSNEIINQAYIKANEIINTERKKLENEIYRDRKELDRERRKLEELQLHLERKSEQIDTREKELKNKERQLQEREKAISIRERTLEEKLMEISKKLEEVASMTREEAKKELLRSIEMEVRYEAAQLAHRIREEARLKAERDAKEIIAQAIQRCASSQTSETTISVVELPLDDIKGRIIGREGRNIRALESIMGVEIIIDDTPEVIVLSSFDAIRREKAKLCIERLIEDGRIHPARIEEIYKKVEEEFENHIRSVGEETVLNLEITPIHSEVIYHIGKMKYRSSYGQNLLLHSIETAKLAAIIASELRLDKNIAKRAGLLHDIGKVIDEEGPHAIVGGQFLKKYGESEIVVNAVMAHHGDVEPISPYAPIVAAADAISGSRPGARRESIEKYIQRIQRLEEIAYEHSGVEKAFAIQAGREIRVIVDANKVSDIEAYEIARSISRRIEDELQFPGQIKVVVIRETRAIEYAR
ncbi:MAG: ribonuclease Y [candidate division WOR-3 bacterium]|nr:ribonuclease Y [candidate division WOR-3 bacterium]MCX7948038.1 ribonuclease Y [candidate division WOR-3 bacterium]MDW8151065.1 ribonuclease Y [candidate division WOR-3 bacterium]